MERHPDHTEFKVNVFKTRGSLVMLKVSSVRWRPISLIQVPGCWYNCQSLVTNIVTGCIQSSITEIKTSCYFDLYIDLQAP